MYKMPWKEYLVMDQKKRFVLESLEGNVNFTKLCATYCISTKTGYKWKHRFLEYGFKGLEDLSKRPKTNPNRLTEDIILEIINIKIKKKNWGSRKIREIYAAKHPNHVWTVDFKGWWYTPDKEKVNPLTVRDEYSKYILCIKAMEKGDMACVYREIDSLFKIYGLPEIILSDNGPPFANMQSLLGLTKLSVWWLSLGISLDRIEPGSPHQNGAHERMHLDMSRELEGQIDGNLRVH
jgi:transposase InsO family protein